MGAATAIDVTAAVDVASRQAQAARIAGATLRAQWDGGLRAAMLRGIVRRAGRRAISPRRSTDDAVLRELRAAPAPVRSR